MKRIIAAIAIMSVLNACATTSPNSLSANGVDEMAASAEQDYQSGDYDNAQKKFETVLKQSPDNYDALFRLGNIALRQSRLPAARKYYRSVLDLQSNSTKAHYNLALVNLLEAEQHFHFHTATAKENPEQQARLFTLIEAIHYFLDDDKKNKKPKSALDNLADALGQK